MKFELQNGLNAKKQSTIIKGQILRAENVDINIKVLHSWEENLEIWRKKSLEHIMK